MITKLLLGAIDAALSAGDAIMQIYSTPFTVELKDDQSPLTAADKAAHSIIQSSLAKYDFPILSEEGKSVSYDERNLWKQYWCVDPLDGTKEFIKRNGEFTVNIAFVENNSPTLGVIYQPQTGNLFAGCNGQVYFFKKEDHITLNENNLSEFIIDSSEPSSDKIVVVASRSHLSPKTVEYITQLKETGREIEMINAGSALKFCLIAAGKATVYPRFAPTMEWDTAAGHAILKACGKNIFTYPSGLEMVYNKQSLVNEWFVAR